MKIKFMEKIVYSNYRELSINTALQIAKIVSGKPGSLLCFPAGETSAGIFEELVKLQLNGKADFSRCRIVGLDEWVHIGEMKHENCYHFLKSRLFDPMGFTDSRICFFNGEAGDLQNECAVTDEFIKEHGPIDMMLLGAGMNGHLGLNEPGVQQDRYSHVVELDNVTKEVGQKYFSKPVSITKGITLGMKHIMEAKTVIVQISGKKKAPVVKRLFESGAAMDFPVSMIKGHANSYLVLDADAA
jgi:glucosamine-6-phosphate isomerase